MRRREVSCVKVISAIALVAVFGMLAAAEAADSSRPIAVRNPKSLPSSLPAERIAIGKAYKPSMALLPNGDLVIVALLEDRSDEKLHEWAGLWRSSDSGKSWSDRVRVERTPGQDLIGREHWLTLIDDGTPDGILFTTCHLLANDTHNPDDYMHSYVNRSTDGGKTWTQTRIGPKGWSSPTTNTMATRNVVEMPDGKLLFGVADFNLPGTEAYVWTSDDMGVTWQQSAQLTMPSYTNYQGSAMPFENLGSFFSESWLYFGTEGELINIVRLDRGSPLFSMSANPPSGNDHRDRMLMTTSTDGGMTWNDLKDVGTVSQECYGQHYSRTTRLDDGRMMMTFTKRGTNTPLGLRAVFSNDDGQTWDFDSDHIIIDDNTPSGWASGGGFGNTIQLSDGSLISAYSCPGSAAGQDDIKTEVVHWSLPQINSRLGK